MTDVGGVGRREAAGEMEKTLRCKTWTGQKVVIKIEVSGERECCLKMFSALYSCLWFSNADERKLSKH